MAIIEKHASPDHSMVLFVDVTDGDWTIGFEGYQWHTHGDILHAWGYSGSPESRTRAFVNDVLHSKRIIAVVRVDAKVTDVIIPEDFMDRPFGKSFAKYSPPNETTELRYWDGQRVPEPTA